MRCHYVVCFLDGNPAAFRQQALNIGVQRPGLSVSESPALAKRIRFIHLVEKKSRSSYYTPPEDFFAGGRRSPASRVQGRGLVPGHLPGTSAATVPCVQGCFRRPRQTHRIVFCPGRSPDLTLNGQPAFAGERRICLHLKRRNRRAAITWRENPRKSS